MPFGTTVVSGVFQCKLDECFGKIEHIIIIADDIMIVAYKPDHSDHDQTFTTLLQAAKKCNVKLNYDKLQYKQKEVELFEESYSTSNHKLIKDNMSAVTSMPSLTNKTQVQSFIGMLNYIAKFSSRLSELAEPIKGLSEDKVLFNWGPEYQQTFVQMKKEISSAPILDYYNPEKKTTL